MTTTNNLFQTEGLINKLNRIITAEDDVVDLDGALGILRKTNVKIMCRNMVRKDYELIRIQDKFLNIFNESNFYSVSNDELLSIDYLIQLAFNKVSIEIDPELHDTVTDFGCQLAFQYKGNGKEELETIKENACMLVNLIFQASTFDTDAESHVFILKEMIKNYSYLNIKYAKKRLSFYKTFVRSMSH